MKAQRKSIYKRHDNPNSLNKIDKNMNKEIRIIQIKARLFDLMAHNCNSGASFGPRDNFTKNKPCIMCQETIRLTNELKHLYND